MTRPAMLLLAAVAGLARRWRSSSIAWRRGSAFSIRRLEPEHELKRRTIARRRSTRSLVFLPVFLFGYASGAGRASGSSSASSTGWRSSSSPRAASWRRSRLWRLRHPGAAAPVTAATAPAEPRPRSGRTRCSPLPPSDRRHARRPSSSALPSSPCPRSRRCSTPGRGAARRHAAGPSGRAARRAAALGRGPPRGGSGPGSRSRSRRALRGNAELLARLRGVAPDAIAVVAYGRILPAAMLATSATRLRQRPRVAPAAPPRRLAGPGGDARGRRRDGRRDDAHRRGARRRARSTSSGASRSGRARGRRGALARGWRASGAELLVETLRGLGARRARAGSAARGADLLPADPARGWRGRLGRARGGHRAAAARLHAVAGSLHVSGRRAGQDPRGRRRGAVSRGARAGRRSRASANSRSSAPAAGPRWCCGGSSGRGGRRSPARSSLRGLPKLPARFGH